MEITDDRADGHHEKSDRERDRDKERDRDRDRDRDDGRDRDRDRERERDRDRDRERDRDRDRRMRREDSGPYSKSKRGNTRKHLLLNSSKVGKHQAQQNSAYWSIIKCVKHGRFLYTGGSRKQEELDPMDPSAYSDAPR